MPLRFHLTLSCCALIVLGLAFTSSSGTLLSNDVDPPVQVTSTNTTTTAANASSGRARLQKNRVRGPADLGLYFINSPGNCGGMSTSVCSKSCGALGYPVYWCYPKICYCHFG